MPTLDAIRSAGERELERLLSDLDARQRAQVREAIRQYGRVQDVPEQFWDRIRREVEEETVAALYLLMLSADSWTTGEIARQGAGVAVANARDSAGYALDAGRRAQNMAAQTTDTLRNRLARKVEDGLVSPAGGVGTLTDADLNAALEDTFSQARRDAIAANETTGSLSKGQIGAADRARETVTVEMRWKTEQDDRVCPRCSPLEEQPEEVWSLVFPDGPGEGSHVACRCWLRAVVVVEEEQAAA